MTHRTAVSSLSGNNNLVDGPETILVAEDSPAARTAARTILQRYGYHVLEATTGKAALAISSKKQQRIDLLLTDVAMPEMSGRVLAEKFFKLRPNAKVLFMSGYAEDGVVRHGILTAGVDYLEKPFSAEALASKIRSVLNETVPAPIR